MFKNKYSRRITAIALVVLTMFSLLTVAYAAYYNTYTTVATIPNGNGCNKMEGFTAGSTYVYCAKVNNDDSKQVIYRVKQSDGTVSLMNNSDNSTTYTTYLGHANDLVTTAINGTNHFFVATMKEGSESLVKLSYSGNNYSKVGNYTLMDGNTPIKISGLEVLDKNSENIYLLVYAWPGDNTGTSFYKVTIGLNQSSGTIQATHAFDIDFVNAKVNGRTISNITEFLHQGVGYKKGTDKLYVPLTHENVSVVLVYNNVSTASGTISADENLSFRITSNAYPRLFEIESCDNANGRLWFNCNRKTDASDTAHDAVCYFNDYALE